MGELVCKRCGAKAKADTIEAADALIDHGIGIQKGRPCAGEPSDMRWNGAIAFEKKYVPVTTSKPKAKAAPKQAAKPKEATAKITTTTS